VANFTLQAQIAHWYARHALPTPILLVMFLLSMVWSFLQPLHVLSKEKLSLVPTCRECDVKRVVCA
jgi:hypothetical protein